MDLYQQYIHKSRYARYLPELKRREHWDETVERFVSFVASKISNNVLTTEVKNNIKNAIADMKVMPSMRAMMTAGLALDRDNTAGYNCSYLPIDDAKAFDEAMVILMNGTGVGFSVERQYVNKLPEIPEEIYDTDTTITVRDWIHYCQLRMGPETQKEHRVVAEDCWTILCNIYPFLEKIEN